MVWEEAGAHMTLCDAPLEPIRSNVCATPAAVDRWVVLRTRSRQEKAVARQLAARAVRHYLPLIDRVVYWRGRKLRSRVPLFPGYLFLFGQRDDGYSAVETRRVCQIIDVPDQDRFFAEIANIARALEAGQPLMRHPGLVTGTRCRVTAGPLAGLEGVVIDPHRPGRLFLEVHILGQGAVVEVDRDFLEPLE